LSIVQAKAPAESRQRVHFVDKMQAVIDTWLSEPQMSKGDEAASALNDTFDVHWTDATDDPLVIIDDRQTVAIIPVFEDEKFRAFDPVGNPDVLSSPLYSVAYSEILKLVRDRITDADGMEVQ
jgi:hypothetical protein